jgi:NAD(P)-dependent dehydrogenase (short-subunit alcohol dehydrogenase family)
VTGASRGIGRAIAEALGQAGYAVVVNYAQNATSAAAVVEQIHRDGGRAIAVQASVAERPQRDELLRRAAEAYGDVELLVNNAAITTPGRPDMLETTEENWDLVFDTNLKGPFFLTQQVANQMLSARRAGRLTRGTIVNISSISAFTVSTNRAEYCLTKAAVPMLTWLYAARLADDNIQVYEICPGIVATDMTAAVRDKYDRLIADGLTPIRRWGSGDDVARAVVALASGAFSFSTGDRLHVDGGFHIRRL